MSWNWSGAQVETVHTDKTVVAPLDAGVNSFVVSPNQLAALSNSALVVNRDSEPQFSEPNDGWYLDVNSPVSRVQQNYQPIGAPIDALIGPEAMTMTAMRWGNIQANTQIRALRPSI